MRKIIFAILLFIAQNLSAQFVFHTDYKSGLNTPILTVIINGKEYDFLIDTGANFSMINENEAHNFYKSDIIDFNVVTLNGDEQKKRGVYIIEIFNIKYPFVEADFTAINKSYLKYNVYLTGIIGADFMRTNSAQIDFFKQVFNLTN